MKAKLKSFPELSIGGYIFRCYADGVILSNGEGSWKFFKAECFKDDYVFDLSAEDYSDYKNLFEILED